MKNYFNHKIDTIQAIPDYKFIGYYWISDQEKPEMLSKEPFPKELFGEGKNPFCIEAMLYSRQEQLSIHILHTGRYLVSAYDLSKLEGLELEEKSYLSHKLNHVEKVLFKQVWEEDLLRIDENESMPTLKPTALIFCGFKK
jgi:CRISPR type III-associated protein (TIGR04423 family)